MNPDIRGREESYEAFRARRKRNRARLDHWLKGRLFWDSRVNGTILKVDKDTYKRAEPSPFSIGK